MSFDHARRFRDNPNPSPLEFSPLDVYKRRQEIVTSIDVYFGDNGRWLGICSGRPPAPGPLPEVLEWCEANMRSPYAFSKLSVVAVTLDNLHLHVTDEVDALNFMMRWF